MKITIFQQLKMYFSFSFGQTAIFLLGGKTKEEKPSAIFLKSGDIVVIFPFHCLSIRFITLFQ